MFRYFILNAVIKVYFFSFRVNVPFMCQTMKFQKQFKIRPDLTGSDRISQDQTRTDRIRPVRKPEGQSCVPEGPER